jgi:cytoskeletal protein CcmA (bactofilin family)
MTTTLIARRTRIGGAIDTEGDLIVEGRVEGTIRAGGTVIVGASGVAVSDLVVARAVVLGIVIGNVEASERVDIGAGARVVGDLRAPIVAVTPPGAVEGRISETAEPAARTRPTLRLGSGTRQPEPAESAPSTWPMVRPARPEAARPPKQSAPHHPGAPAPPAPVPDALREPPTAPRPIGRVRMLPRRGDGER